MHFLLHYLGTFQACSREIVLLGARHRDTIIIIHLFFFIHIPDRSFISLLFRNDRSFVVHGGDEFLDDYEEQKGGQHPQARRRGRVIILGCK